MDNTARVDRGARRKARTRARLLEAAQVLFAHRGLDNVSIQDITDAADVGFGTFYNHFASKPEILEAVADAYLDRYDEAMDRLTADVTDPAEIVCVGWRHTLAGALDPEWFPILKQTPSALRGRIADRALADIRAGMEAGRLRVENLEAFMSCMPSMLLGVMEDLAAGTLGLEDAEYSAVYYLRLMGISEAEAELIVRRPLPAA